jgi:VWFA-related protein
MEGRSIVRNARALTAFFLAALLAATLTPKLVAQDKAPVKAEDKSDSSTLTPGKDVIGSVTTHAVITPVTVTDRNGNIVNGLGPKDFRLTDNGKIQKITEDIAVHPISMVIAVQANAEVEKMLPAIQKVGSAISAQILGDDGEAAVIEFDHRIQTLGDFSSNPDKLSAALKKLKPGSSSSRLNDATIEGINLLRRRPDNRRKILLLIAESRDNGSELKAREVLSAAEFANVVIYAIDISKFVASVTASPSASRNILDTRPPGAVYAQGPMGGVETPTTISQNNMGNWTPVIKDLYDLGKGIFIPPPLEVYTTYTGGRQYAFKSQRELERAVSDLGEELHSQYLLTYQPNNKEEAGYHNIVVQVLKPYMKIRARDGYYWAGGKTP